MKNITLTICYIFMFYVSAIGQQNVNPDSMKQWWGNIDGYINQQDKVSLNLVTKALQNNPPSVNDVLERRMAYLLMDNVLHEEKAPYRSAVQFFFRQRIADAIEQIRTEKVKNGAVIWKLYNHAFVVKTASVTIGFDIQRGVVGVKDFLLDNDQISRLADVVDILFISHSHDDHADRSVAEIFIKKKKIVVTTPDLWMGTALYNKITHLERFSEKTQEIALPSKGLKLKVINYPGHQESLINNVYLVITSEGLSFLHSGDQMNKEDFSWIDHVWENHKIDVAMINSWAMYPEQRVEKGFRPNIIIPGHENELGHSIDHRESYWLNDVRLGDKSVFPWVQMVWGEKYHYIAYPNKSKIK